MFFCCCFLGGRGVISHNSQPACKYMYMCIMFTLTGILQIGGGGEEEGWSVSKGEVPDLTSRLMTFEKTISCVVEVASYTEAAEA